MEIYGVNLRIQSECKKIRIRNNSVFGQFSRKEADLDFRSIYYLFKMLGYFCPLKTRHPSQHPCPAGSWSNLTNLEKEADCYQCPKGYYCLKGSSEPSGICPTGHYCPPGV